MTRVSPLAAMPAEAPPESGATLTKPGPRAPATDRDLVDRARAGDRRAFGELVKRHQRRIHRLALHMLRDHAAAEDVTQEAFVRAYGAIGRFDGRSEPFTWLYRIAVNLSLNLIRSRKSERRASGVPSDDPRLDGIADPPKGAAAAPVDAARRQLYAVLAAEIDRLSETLRTTLILVCIDGRSHEEAAHILGAPEGTIAWRVHEARRRLREALGARGFDMVEALAESGGTP